MYHYRLRLGKSVQNISECIGMEDIEKMVRWNLVKKYRLSHERLVHLNCHYLPQSEYVFDVEGCRVCDDVFVFEEFEDQLKSLLETYGFTPRDNIFESIVHKVSCPVINILDLDTEVLKIINQRYVNDFRNFGYEMIIPNESLK